MKIFFFVACVVFCSSTYGQQDDFLTLQPKIQKHIQKKNKERLIEMAAKLNDHPGKPKVIICYPPWNLLQQLDDQIRNQRNLYANTSSGEINTPLLPRNLCDKPESCIKAPDYTTNQWKIKPLTQARFKNLRDFLKESGTTLFTFFN